MGELIASQLGGRRGRGLDLDSLAAPDPLPGSYLVELGCGPWSMEDQFRNLAKQGPCPVCRGQRIPFRRFYCGACDRAGTDGKVLYPGLGVDEAPDPDWKPEPTVYQPSASPGGVGPAKGSDRPLRRRIAKRKRSA